MLVTTEKTRCVALYGIKSVRQSKAGLEQVALQRAPSEIGRLHSGDRHLLAKVSSIPHSQSTSPPRWGWGHGRLGRASLSLKSTTASLQRLAVA